jgi:small subunit ribosomal protein S20
MPITKSAIKRERSNERKRLQNATITSALKTFYKGFQKAVIENDTKTAQEKGRLVMRVYDKAASKGVIPKGRADRKKERIQKALNKLLATKTD